MFYFYMPDTVKHIGLSAVMAETNTPVPLNGKNVYQYPLEGEEGTGKEGDADKEGNPGNNNGDDGNKDTTKQPNKSNPTTPKSLVVKGTKFHH